MNELLFSLINKFLSTQLKLNMNRKYKPRENTFLTTPESNYIFHQLY